jgi:hypothetical protein
MRNAETEVDFENKATVQRVLRINFGLSSLMDEVLFISKLSGKIEKVDQRKFNSKEEILTKYFVHNPDLVIRGFNFPVVCEIDGDVHWQSSKGIKQTNTRNKHYEDAGIKMLWLTRKDAESENLEKIIETKLKMLLNLQPLRL